jgi:hypothetical protein
MIRKALVLSAASVALCAALAASSSRAAGDDTVQLRVEAPSIDGALRFASSSGWTWRCTLAVCTVNTARGRTMTITAESGAASTFQWWGGACAASGAQPKCTIQVNDSQVLVTAHFSTLRLWLPTFGGGSINVGPAKAGGAPLVGHPCGSSCVDLANGEQVVLRAAPSNGNRMIAWGGACASLRSTQGCLLTLRRNTVVSATFERIPPPGDCPPGNSCDPVGSSKQFVVRVTGTGTVLSPRMGSISQMTCQSSSATGRSCTVDRLLEQWVSMTATGVHFLGWGGRCHGTGATCSFYNGAHSREEPVVIARFG